VTADHIIKVHVLKAFIDIAERQLMRGLVFNDKDHNSMFWVLSLTGYVINAELICMEVGGPYSLCCQSVHSSLTGLSAWPEL